MTTHAVAVAETAGAAPYEVGTKVSHLLTDTTYRGSVLLGNVQCFATAGNSRLINSESGAVVALFLTEEDANAAAEVAGEGFEVAAGTAYDVSDLL